MWRPLIRALAVALLVPCFLGVYDGVILLTSRQRLQRTAAALAASVAAAGPAREQDFAALFAYAQEQARPDDVTLRGAVIVTAIEPGAGGRFIPWQRRTGDAAVASRYGEAGGAARLDPGAPPAPLVATELVAPLGPWVIGVTWLPGLGQAMLRATSLQRIG